MKLTRRALFGIVAAAVAAPFAAPLVGSINRATLSSFDVPTAVLDAPTSGTYGGIERATFSFWRNRQGEELHMGVDLRDAMSRAMNRTT